MKNPELKFTEHHFQFTQSDPTFFDFFFNVRSWISTFTRYPVFLLTPSLTVVLKPSKSIAISPDLNSGSQIYLTDRSLVFHKNYFSISISIENYFRLDLVFCGPLPEWGRKWKEKEPCVSITGYLLQPKKNTAIKKIGKHTFSILQKQ